MTKMNKIACLVLAAGCLAAAGAIPVRAQDKGRQVFVLQSDNPEYIWSKTVDAGIHDALEGLDVAYTTYYMDAKRRHEPAQLRQAAQEALQLIGKSSPQVVISVDDAAQALVVAPHLKGLDRPQVVFCGVNALPSAYGFPAANVSGVRERWHYREGFALLKRISPSLHSVAFLIEESETGRFVVEDMLDETRRNGPFSLKLAGVEVIRTYQEWQRLVLYYQTRADALALGIFNTLVDEATGQVVPPKVVMDWTHSVNTRPTLGFSDAAKNYGLMCAVMESGHEQGFLAGSMAREILTRGVPAGSLPVEINAEGVVLLNLRVAERLGVKIPYGIIEAAGVVLQ